MISDLSLLHAGLRNVHIGAGFLGLLAFWIPVFARKGGRVHIGGGRVFAWTVYIVGYSALVSSFWALFATESYLAARGASPADLPGMTDNVRFLSAILAFLALFVLASLQMGIAAVRTKKSPELLAGAVLRGWSHALGLGGVLLAGFGTFQLFRSDFALHYLTCVALGAVGVQEWREATRFLANPRPTPMAWWYRHMESMVGCGIAFHTAFLVFGFSRFAPQGVFTGPLALIPWLLPTAIGLPILAKWVRHYRSKFGEAKVG